MRKRFMRWLLSATVFVSSIGFAGIDYGYAASYDVASYGEDAVLTDGDAIEEYANEQFLSHKEEFVIKIYQGDNDPMEVATAAVDNIQMADCHYELNTANFSFFVEDGVINLIVKCTYITTDEQNEEFLAALDEVMKGLKLDGKTDYEKVRIIHDYVCDNVDYDYDNLSKGEEYPIMYNAYAALMDGKAVCQGYAGLFYRMCNEAGVEAKVIAGYGNGQRHAWNIVKIGDEYFNIDTTWDGQYEATTYEYFLNNEPDFILHDRDTQYEGEFYEKYPMALSSWIDFKEFTAVSELNQDNIKEVSFNTIDGKKVTNQAEGKPKIIIYGDTKTCSNAAMTMRSLVAGEFSDVDIIFVDCFGNTLETVTTFEESNVGGKFPVAYKIEGDTDIDYSFWTYCHNALGLYDKVTPPFIVYIDANNKVQYAEITGYFSAYHVREIINTYIEGNKPIALSEENITLLSGDNKEIKVFVYGTEKNAQFFTWTSSDASVVAVDGNGLVKAIGEGKAVITCKVNDSISYTCDVVVSKPVVEIKDGLNKDADGVWRYYVDGAVATSHTGLVKNKYGWWHVTNGVLDTTYTGMSRNKYGWWYVKKGKLDTSVTGLVKYKSNWVYVNKGKLDASYTGMAKNQYGWWYVKNGKLDLTYTGMAKNQYGWWYMKNGKLDLTYTGMAKNKYGWWHMTNGKLDLTYTGISTNAYGWWYVKKGKLDTSYTGEATYDGETYDVKNGLVVK